jgi:hypothetical protein
MTIEPLEDEPKTNPRTARPPTPPGSGPRSRAGGSQAAQKSRSSDSSDDSPPPENRRPAPRPAPGILGRFFQPPQGSSRGDSRSSSSTASARPKQKETEKEKADDKPEPLTDAAIKRKIEKQIRETLGDRVKSLEVRVSGRNVLIVGQATRFWQKRAVRRSLETLPVLEGYRARIQLDD